MRRVQTLTLAALPALLLALAPAGVCEAQSGVPHLILEVLKTAQDTLYGYRVYHEEAKTEYHMMIPPETAEVWRCNLSGLDRIMVDEADQSYEGRDGKPCRYATFRPEVKPPTNDELPIPQGPSRPPCPTCPG